MFGYFKVGILACFYCKSFIQMLLSWICMIFFFINFKKVGIPVCFYFLSILLIHFSVCLSLMLFPNSTLSLPTLSYTKLLVGFSFVSRFLVSFSLAFVLVLSRVHQIHVACHLALRYTRQPSMSVLAQKHKHLALSSQAVNR